MSDVGNALRIPMFLAAPSREELVRLMLSNNLKRGKEYRYFDISFDGSKWVTWFYEVIDVKKSMPKPKAGS